VAREQRRLAAILAADVVGYCRLIGRDESEWRERDTGAPAQEPLWTSRFGFEEIQWPSGQADRGPRWVRQRCRCAERSYRVSASHSRGESGAALDFPWTLFEGLLSFLSPAACASTCPSWPR